MKLSKQATYIRYVLAKLSKFVQIRTQTSSDSILQRIFELDFGTSFQARFFMETFDKKFYFVMLYKLAKFHNQTVFTSKVIQKNVFRISCLGI